MDKWVPLNKIQLTGLEVKQDQLEPTVDSTALKEEPTEVPDTEEVLEVSKGRGNKRLIFVVKSVVVFALFGFLFYWASEVTFREPPAMDSNNRMHSEWRGWKTEWTKPNFRDLGPVKYISEFNKEYGPTKYYGMVAEEMFEWNRAEAHISGWLFFMGFCGVIFGVFCAHSWSKKVKETQDFTTPFVPLSLRNWLMGAAIILTLIIIPFEIRNKSLHSQREANFNLVYSVLTEDLEEAKNQLNKGADINIVLDPHRITRHNPVGETISSEQLKTLREELGWYPGMTPVQIARSNEDEDMVELLISKTPALNKDELIGTYQIKLPNGLFTMTLLKDGTSLHVKLNNSGEEESDTGKWKIEDGNLVTVGKEGAGIMKINPDGSLTMIATIENGVRENLDPKISSLGSMKKIK